MLEKPYIVPLASTADFHLVTQNYVDCLSLTFLEASYNDLRDQERVLGQAFLPPLQYPALFELSLS